MVVLWAFSRLCMVIIYVVQHLINELWKLLKIILGHDISDKLF